MTLPTIQVTGELPVMTAAAVDALADANTPEPVLFDRGGLLTRVAVRAGEPVLERLDQHAVRHHLARAADWVKITAKGPVPVMPPTDVVRDLMAMAGYPFPLVTAIVDVPFFGPDGTIRTERGYDPGTGNYLVPATGVTIPPVDDSPSDDDIRRARNVLTGELLADFPFTGEPEKAHAVSLFLGPFIRGLLPPEAPSPLHNIEASTPASGKTLLSQCLLIPSCGPSPHILTAARDEDEWRKRITAMLVGGPRAVIIDNLAYKLDSPNLAAALTTTEWSDRILGESREVTLPARCSWACTGNNPTFSRELARRTVRCRLEPTEERPWNRPADRFRHPNLKRWVIDNRGGLIWAALTMGRAWISKGRPVDEGPVLGMFEDWSATTGGVLAVAGIEGFLGNIDEFCDHSDAEIDEWVGFIAAWWIAYRDQKVGVADLWLLVLKDHGRFYLGEGNSDRAQRTRFGILLRSMDGRRWGDLTLRFCGVSHNASQYQLVKDGTTPPPITPKTAGTSVQEPSNGEGSQVTLEVTTSEKSLTSEKGNLTDLGNLFPSYAHAHTRTCEKGWNEVNPPPHPAGDLVAFDLETAGDRLWEHGPGFVRIAGYRDGDGITVTNDPSPLLAGGVLVGHNIWSFDVLALARYHGLDLATVSAIDTKLLAFLADPPPARMPEAAFERHYSLHEVATRLFGETKLGDLKALSREFGGYDRIPLTDRRYLDYCRRDVELAEKIVEHYELTGYAVREHEIARIAGIMSLSGFRVDERLLKARLEAGERIRAEMIERLSAYGLPTTRKDGTASTSPQATDEGKAAIVAAFADLGVELKTTPKGAPSIGKVAMAAVIESAPGTEAAALAETVMQLCGVRTVYQTVADHLVDGRVHPQVSLRQASGRMSTSRPGLTVMGKHDGRAREREIFLADEGHVIITADLAQVDARAVAALSQDPGYLALFEDGRDLHTEIAQAVWGDPSRRQAAKMLGHGWNYGMGIRGIVERARVTEAVAQEFDAAMRSNFPRLVAWRAEMREIARAGLLLDNGFGRKMRPNPDRAHTQGPALMGQGCARDCMMEGLLHLPTDILPMLRACVHDEVVLSVPEADADEVEAEVVRALSFEWAPPGASRPVSIIAEAGGHRTRNWGQAYLKEAS